MPNDIRVPSFAPLKAALGGALFDDVFARGRYATDASIYQMMPHAVVVPESLADVEATLDFARKEGLAVLPRRWHLAMRADGEQRHCHGYQPAPQPHP